MEDPNTTEGQRLGSGDGEQMTTMNTTTDHRAVACIRFVRRLFWPIAALTAPLCILWPWLFWVTIIAAAADMVCNRIEFNARMKEMDRIWEHEREERKRELLERLEGPPNDKAHPTAAGE